MKKILSIIFIVCIVVVSISCASNPYKIQQTVEKESLSQNTVILEVVMAPRAFAVIPLIDAGIYQASAKKAEPALSLVETKKLQSMNSEISKAYADMFNANVAQSDFSFEEDKITLEYFSNAGQETKERLINLCKENEAEMIVTIILQVNGTGVSMFGIKGGNAIDVAVCIFNKEGQIAAQGKVRTGIQTAGASDTVSYALLFDNGITYCISLLKELTSSK
jgi:hypothetical protein